MSDTVEETAVSHATKSKSISTRNLGGGRKPSPQEETSSWGGAYLGSISGFARGFRIQTSEDKQTGEIRESEPLTGHFECHPSNPKLPKLTAATLYLPSGFHDEILDLVSTVDPESNVRKPTGTEVAFVYDVVCISATNKAGFTYQMIPQMLNHKQNDAAERMKKLMDAADKARKLRLAAPAKAA